MIALQLLIILAVLATLYWAAGHHSPTNHAEQDENATGSGGRDVEPGINGWDVTPIHQEEQ